MEQAHSEVGLPFQETWTSEETEPGVTMTLGLPDGFFMMLDKKHAVTTRLPQFVWET